MRILAAADVLHALIDTAIAEGRAAVLVVQTAPDVYEGEWYPLRPGQDPTITEVLLEAAARSARCCGRDNCRHCSPAA